MFLDKTRDAGNYGYIPSRYLSGSAPAYLMKPIPALVNAQFVAQSADDLDALGTCHAAAIQGLIPFGPKTGQRTVLWGEAEEIDRPTTPATKKRLCADHDGYSLHAGVRIRACADRRERICRYVARGPIAKDRLSLNKQGDVVYRFRHRWRNGKQAVVMDPMTFL